MKKSARSTISLATQVRLVDWRFKHMFSVCSVQGHMKKSAWDCKHTICIIEKNKNTDREKKEIELHSIEFKARSMAWTVWVPLSSTPPAGIPIIPLPKPGLSRACGRRARGSFMGRARRRQINCIKYTLRFVCHCGLHNDSCFLFIFPNESP